MNSPGQILTKRWGGETRLILERDQKRDQAKKQSLKIFFGKFCSQSSTRNINLDFSLDQLRWLPLKWFILRQNETQGTLWDSLRHPIEFFLPLPSESVRAFGVRSHTLTSEPNFLGSIGPQFSLPIFLRFARADVQQLLILFLLLSLLFLTDVLFIVLLKAPL